MPYHQERIGVEEEIRPFQRYELRLYDALATAIALILERGITLPSTAKSPPFGFLPAPSECELTERAEYLERRSGF
jgi:hypothetical protein